MRLRSDTVPLRTEEPVEHSSWPSWSSMRSVTFFCQETSVQVLSLQFASQLLVISLVEKQPFSPKSYSLHILDLVQACTVVPTHPVYSLSCIVPTSSHVFQHALDHTW